MTLKRSAATFACVSALAGSVLGGVAYADPDNTGTVTYSYYDCSGDVDPFDAVKQPGGAAALHVEGGGTFVVLQGVVLGNQTVDDVFYANGTVLYDTPGFSKGTNGLPTITCTNRSATSGILQRVLGYFAPTK